MGHKGSPTLSSVVESLKVRPWQGHACVFQHALPVHLHMCRILNVNKSTFKQQQNIKNRNRSSVFFLCHLVFPMPQHPLDVHPHAH